MFWIENRKDNICIRYRYRIRYLDSASNVLRKKMCGVTSHHWKCSHCVFCHCGASTVGSCHTKHVSHPWPQASYGEAIFVLHIATNWKSHTLLSVCLKAHTFTALLLLIEANKMLWNWSLY